MNYEEFLHELQEALSHLHDPHFVPSGALCRTVGCDLRDSTPTVQGFIVRAIQGLKPPPDTPPRAETRQLYDVLHNRFQLGLTQEETAYRLNVSRRTINRLQHRAVHMLACALTNQLRPGSPGPGTSEAGPGQSTDWGAQFQRELDSLQAREPVALSDVCEAIDNALHIVQTLTAELGVRVVARHTQPQLVAAVHPVVLNQVMVSAIRHLAPHIADGEIGVYARLEDGKVKITLTGQISLPPPAEAELVSEISVAPAISLTTHVTGAQAFIWIEAPSARKLTVLVVDDNDDMARFYRDCTIGTDYHIVHVASGKEVAGAVHRARPQIIVLDVMLPDVDGWRLLMRLREDPESRSIPVVVCSVVREEELARSLGAAGFLAKPVRPRQFVKALDQTQSGQSR